MRKYVLFLSLIGMLAMACSKDDHNEPVNPGPVPNPAPVAEPGIMHIKASDYTEENASLMLQDGESRDILDWWSGERAFKINEPMTAVITAEGKLRIKFFSARPVLHVEIYAPMSSGKSYFKLATYDSVPAFGESKIPVPMIRKGDKLILESGDSTRAETSFSLAEDAELKIVCQDEYYQKVTTHNKCRWSIDFSPYAEGPYRDPVNRWLRPVHAREAVALFTNMAYLFSTDEFIEGHLRLQGRIYGNAGYGNWVDMEELLGKIHGPRTLSACIAVNAMGVAGIGGIIFGLNEILWFSHYHDTAQGDASGVAFHEFGHILGFEHTSNMTYGVAGDPDRAEWSDNLCHKLYMQMCFTQELPVWSCSFLKSKYCQDAYDYEDYIDMRP